MKQPRRTFAVASLLQTSLWLFLLAPLLAAADGPVRTGDIPVDQKPAPVEITDRTEWLPPIPGPVRLTYYTTYGDRTEPFQITRVHTTGTGMFKYPDRDGVARYQPFRTTEQVSETAVNYLGKPIRQTQSIRRWYDMATNEVVRVELAATSGQPPNYLAAEIHGAKLKLSHRLLPGDDPDQPDGGEQVRELTLPPGGFIPLDLQFAARHARQWNWPVNAARRFTVFVPEEGLFRTWWLERLPNEKIDLPHLPQFDTLRFRMVSGPAPDQATYRAWDPRAQLDQAQQFWINPHTGELLRAITPGPVGSRTPAKPGQPEADPERTITHVSYADQPAPALVPRLVVAPNPPPRPLARLTGIGPLDFAVVLAQKQVGSAHFEFLAFSPPPEIDPAPEAPPPAEANHKFLRDCAYRSLARLTLNAGQGERRETAETWYLPDGRVRKLLITGRRTLQDTLAYLQEIYCVGEIFSINGVHIEQIPDLHQKDRFTDGRKTPWSRAHVRDANLRVFDTNRIEHFLALAEQVELVERPDWRIALYQIQSDTPQMADCRLTRISGPAALEQFAAAIKIPSRSDPDRDSFPQRSDIQLVAAQGDPLPDPAAADWRNRLRDGQAAAWLLTLSGPSSGIFAYFGANHRLYAVLQRERDGRELRWVAMPPEDKTLGAPATPARPIYPRDW